MKRRYSSNNPFRKIFRPHGGVMIITLLILLAIMLSFAIIGIATVIRERQGFVEEYRMKVAEQAANACGDIAIDRLGRDGAYAGNESLDIGGGITCTIRPIVASGGWIIQTESTVDGRVARYQIQLVNRNPVDITSWSKVGSF
ncbi:MAG: hypothetical protein KIH65_000535 [Candidatus Uhrbacteria bacterium]|nr:hypothetical protein [Candidatus Uhrbacteria bacterium]